MDYHIIKISRNKKQYLDLLLLGDEQETMIDRYLERGDLFVLEDNGIKAVGVVPSGTKQWNYQFRFLDRGRRRGSRYLKNRKIPERCLFPAE